MSAGLWILAGVLLCAVLFIYHAATAVVGWEDDNGFHRGEQP